MRKRNSNKHVTVVVEGFVTSIFETDLRRVRWPTSALSFFVAGSRFSTTTNAQVLKRTCINLLCPLEARRSSDKQLRKPILSLIKGAVRIFTTRQNPLGFATKNQGSRVSDSKEGITAFSSSWESSWTASLSTSSKVEALDIPFFNNPKPKKVHLLLLKF